MKQKIPAPNYIYSYFATYVRLRAKTVVSNCPGLVDFVIGLVNSVLDLPNGQVKCFEEFKLQKSCSILIKISG